ncbi:protein phosphatase 2C domain-containing protein [Streptomyces orinoci]|uniref:Protein phosphatase 2C domain-containing protein n=1 Tax=Streptomyces orinoci TaxID=67339 RepID=A0ABV3K017_STRON|nr:protein phosphatase 2C domain-containing protein [Streptomyces orinoci]
MSQLGDQQQEDAWWAELYGWSASDLGAVTQDDTLDDRFASAASVVGVEPPPGAEEPPAPPRPPRGKPLGWDIPRITTGLPDPARFPPLPDLAGPLAGVRPVEPPWELGEPPVPPPSARALIPRPQAPAPVETTSGPEPPAPLEPAEGPPPPAALAAAPVPPAPVPPAADEPSRAPGYVGQGPPTYEAEPTAWPAADPGELADLVPDTVLDGARYGAMTLRALSVRGDSARYRGEPRRDALLTARFGAGDAALLLIAVASGARAAEGAHRAARDICSWMGAAVGRSHTRLSEDIRAGRRGELKTGLHRLADRSYGRLRARAAELGLDPAEYTAALRCLLLPADPACRTRVFFGVGGGGLFRLREGAWQDLEPAPPPAEPDGGPEGGAEDGAAPAGDRITVDLGIPTPGTTPVTDPAEVPSEPFRFRASVARPGDVLLLCSAGLADPLRGEPRLGELLARRWSARHQPPGLAEFLLDAQTRVKGYADDRTACAVWEA